MSFTLKCFKYKIEKATNVAQTEYTLYTEKLLRRYKKLEAKLKIDSLNQKFKKTLRSYVQMLWSRLYIAVFNIHLFFVLKRAQQLQSLLSESCLNWEKLKSV